MICYASFCSDLICVVALQILGLLSALLYLRQDIPHSPLTKTAPIVLCAPSNTAVDELLKRLHVHGVHNAQGNRRTSLKLVRLGKAPSDKSVTEDGKPSISVELSLDAQVNVLVMNSPRWKELQTATRTITECQQKLNALKGRDSDVSSTSTSKKQLSAQLATARLTKLRSGVALDNIRLECRRQVLLQADIIVGTLSSLGAAVMLEHVISENIVFDTVIIDEAAQVCRFIVTLRVNGVWILLHHLLYVGWIPYTRMSVPFLVLCHAVLAMVGNGTIHVNTITLRLSSSCVDWRPASISCHCIVEVSGDCSSPL